MSRLPTWATRTIGTASRWGLGLAELVGDDLVVACLDELEPDETDDSFAPQEWLDVDEPGS
jgi:hypothetical protein